MFNFRRGLFVVMLVAAIVVVACGDKDDPTPAPVPPTMAPEPTAAPVAAIVEAPKGDAKNGETLFNQTCIADRKSVV